MEYYYGKGGYRYIRLVKMTVFDRVERDAIKDDIKLFADYIMDLDENQHSFYFTYSFKVDKRLFIKNLSDSYEKLKKDLQS